MRTHHKYTISGERLIYKVVTNLNIEKETFQLSIRNNSILFYRPQYPILRQAQIIILEEI